MKATLILLVAILVSTSAYAVTWKFEITYPTITKKEHKPTSAKGFKLDMRDSIWSCKVTEMKKEKDLNERKIICFHDKASKNSPVVASSLSCGPQLKKNKVVIAIGEELSMPYMIRATCEI